MLHRSPAVTKDVIGIFLWYQVTDPLQPYPIFFFFFHCNTTWVWSGNNKFPNWLVDREKINQLQFDNCLFCDICSSWSFLKESLGFKRSDGKKEAFSPLVLEIFDFNIL